MFEISLVFWRWWRSSCMRGGFLRMRERKRALFFVKGTSLCFPAIFGFLSGMFVDFRDFFGVMGVRRSLCTRRRLLRMPERKRALFCSCFKGHHYFPTILPSMLWVVDATYYVLWFYESFRVLLWGSVSMGTRGHKQPTLISMFRYFIKQNNIS